MTSKRQLKVKLGHVSGKNTRLSFDEAALANHVSKWERTLYTEILAL